ncbi:MAG: formate dehydrogenase [Rhodoferax sp.]|uniref:formate dehydrogenase n=1 Tax=Rhodoferax sp. TaxID=50421 RepID=UPI00271B7812|nr:formate dehydrogenase [Rhodoferax sp.]MDO8447965.1 formate dehydrogenase [Rhodoferax sp.]MDO9165564.1 formate dehydrogenase [Rhodoferax sp.]
MSQSTSKLSRRTLFAGASTVGAIAAVASLMPSVQGVATVADQPPKATPEKGGGYHLSAHVKQYYKTTLV